MQALELQPVSTEHICVSMVPSRQNARVMSGVAGTATISIAREECNINSIVQDNSMFWFNEYVR